MPACEAVTILCSASDQANAQQLAVPVVLNARIALPHDIKAGNWSKNTTCGCYSNAIITIKTPDSAP